jgi:hypothetical protein
MSSSENEEFYFNTNSEILGYQWEPEYSENGLLEMNQKIYHIFLIKIDNTEILHTLIYYDSLRNM